MDLKSYLDEMGVPYQWQTHPTTYTAQDLAAMEHVPGRRVIKPVVVEADGQFIVCAVPASHKVDLGELREELRADQMRLAEENELNRLFEGCEVGAEPPIGRMFGLPTLMDEALFNEKEVTFQAGTHRDAITMNFADYFRLAQPAVGHFGRHL